MGKIIEPEATKQKDRLSPAYNPAIPMRVENESGKV